jgi:aminoglycoside 3-N-acetyltransferase I
VVEGPTVQRLTIADVGKVRALNALFGRAFEDPETYASQPPSDAYLTRLLGEDHVVVLTATIQGVVIGGLVAYELRKFEQQRREIYIYDLAVAAEHRRRGVASALIHRLRDIAAEREAWVLFVQADPGDVPAIRLYEKLGVREDVLHFDIAVPRRS